MNFLRPLTLSLLLVLITAQAQTAETFAGTWRGAIEIPGSPLEVVVTFTAEGEALAGSIDIPAQGAAGLPLEPVTLQGEELSFAIAGVPGEPTFTGSLVDGTLQGTFTQAGQTFPFALEPGSEGAVGSAQEGRYADPEGRFSVPIPTNWTVTGEDGYVILSDPGATSRIYLLTVEATDVEAAIAEAWAQVDPTFALEPDDVLEPPSQAGVERTVFIQYDSEDDARIHQAVGQLYEGSVYLLLVDADLVTAQQRAAQFQIITSGFRIEALDEDDLSGAEPLPVAEVIPELEAFIQENLEAFGIPGATVAIVQGGEVVYTGGFGVREAGGTQAMTPDTHMMIGSTGKTLTTLLMATLVDEGLMTWDTPAVEVLPEFAVADPDRTARITMRNLVCACTGVPRRDLELFFNAGSLSAEGIVASLRTFEFFTDFGEAFQYSNQLVATAGYAAAAADGASFGTLYEGYVSSLQNRVLEPIGMLNTTLSFEEVEARGEHGIPHQRSLGSGEYVPIGLETERLLLPVAPAGAHWSTAEDMADYLIMQLAVGVARDGTRVVSEESLRTLWEPQVPISATDSYGLGWMVGEYKGLTLLSHGGNTLGFTSEFAFLPEADLGVVVLSNAQASNVFNGAVTGRLFELTFEQAPETEQLVPFALEQTGKAVAELQERILEDVDPEAVTPFLGRYSNEALGELSLTLEEGRLVADAGEFRTELRPTVDAQGEADGYISVDAPFAGSPLELERDEEDKPIIRIGQGAVAYTFTKID